jgi:hypothetical protein
VYSSGSIGTAGVLFIDKSAAREVVAGLNRGIGALIESMNDPCIPRYPRMLKGVALLNTRSFRSVDRFWIPNTVEHVRRDGFDCDTAGFPATLLFSAPIFNKREITLYCNASYLLYGFPL